MTAILIACLMPAVTFLLYQYMTRDLCRCERCEHVTPYLTADGECVSCWEDSVTA